MGQKPDPPIAPVMSISSTYVQIAWPVDAFANYFPLDKYQVLIQTSAAIATFVETTVYCDGSNSVTFTNRYCIVPMAILRQAPYSLTYGATVNAKLLAHNARGWSTASAVTTGPAVQTEPVKMTPIPAQGAATTSTQIEVTWTLFGSAP